MAQKVNITLTDDLDGSTATETVTFGLDGTSYELDLNAKNAAALRKALATYQSAARRIGRSSSTPARRTRRPASEVDARAVRAWAASSRIKVSPRGRIPGDVLAQFQAAGR
jgi:hypothetical protein